MVAADMTIETAPRGARGGRVKQRTLVLIRWIAIAGQLATICVAHFAMGLGLPIGPALAVVSASAIVNLASGRRGAVRTRLSDREAAGYLAYDMIQLTLLLYLTGGLVNPFAVLILAPVIVSATVLSRGSTIGLGLLAGACISLLALYHLPLPWRDGGVELPPLYILGIWEALAVSTLFIATYVGSVAEEARRMQDALAATQLALAREHRLASLGGLAAAAAHELGSPLATIALASRELARELPAESPLAEDVALLISQSARCRDILAELGRGLPTDSHMPFAHLPLSAIVEAAAEPHRVPSIDLVLDAAPAAGAPDNCAEPQVWRSPEFQHGLGNLIQNAIQFARKEVVVRQRWDFERVTVETMDDGPGFPAYLLERIGEPYVSSRAHTGEHMGLGIFIAQNLLERTGAVLTFANRPEGGAHVTVRWQRARMEAAPEESEQ
jgi:two-component system, sensor histidine kinase RegB